MFCRMAMLLARPVEGLTGVAAPELDCATLDETDHKPPMQIIHRRPRIETMILVTVNPCLASGELENS